MGTSDWERSACVDGWGTRRRPSTAAAGGDFLTRRIFVLHSQGLNRETGEVELVVGGM